MVSPIILIWLIAQSPEITMFFGAFGVLILVLLFILWRWMHVNDHLSVTLESDIVVVDVGPDGKVTFTGTVTDTAGAPVAGVPGVLDVTAPDGAKSTIPFTSGDDGKFSIVWDAVLPAGVWSFFSDIEGVDSNPLTITLRTGRDRDTISIGFRASKSY